MSDSGLDYDKIRERAEKRVKMQQEFKLHLIIYVVVNLFLWLVWWLIPAILTGLDVGGRIVSILQFPWPLIVMLCWGVLLLIHGAVVYFEAGGGAEARERAVRREIERERALRSGDPAPERTRWRPAMGDEDSTSEKPKRGARLSDDGELVYDEEDEAEEKPASEQHRRSSKS